MRESGRKQLPPALKGAENDQIALHLAQGNGKDDQGIRQVQKLEEITRTFNIDEITTFIQ